MSGGASVAHVMLDVGVRSETFVTNAIEAVEREGWQSHVIGLGVRGQFTAVPPDRVHCTGAGTLLQRGTARLRGRRPEQQFAEQALGYAKDQRIDLLHAHFGWAGNYAAPLAQLLGVPLVVTFYGTDAAEPAGPYTGMFRQTQHVIAVSDYVKQHLRALGYDGPVELIRNGLPLGRLEMRAAPPPTDEGVRLLYVGRLVPFKGADVLVRAMPAILAADPSVRLDVIGDGPERGAIEAIASDLCLGGAVAFHGARDHAGVLEALRAAHVLVVPGRTMPSGQAETSSMVFKEALALGVPVAATASGALPETCPPAFREELAQPGNPLALAGSVISVLHEPSAWAGRAEEGRRWVSERFNLERIGESLVRYYAGALRDHHQSRAAA